MLAQNDEGVPVIEGMPRLEAFKLHAGRAVKNGVVAPAKGGGARFHQFFCEDILAAVGFHQGIGEFGVQADAHVVREGPGRRGPDDHIRTGRIGGGKDLFETLVGQGEAHIDRGRRVVIVFHLCLGQRRMAGAAPVNGLFGAHHAPGGHKLGQFVSRGRLIGGLHAHVGVFPVAEHAQALEFLALHVNPLGGVFTAELAHHMGRQFLFLFLEFLFDLVFDGQAVAVPAGHVARRIARHVAGFDDNVLENLVQRRAHMNVPVGVGRAVMQDVGSLAARSFHHGGTGIDGFPLFEGFRLALGQIGFHRKGGLGQIQRFFIITHWGSRH